MSVHAGLVLLALAVSPDAGSALDEPSSDSVYQVDSVWTDSAGQRLKLESLRGEVVVLAMVYTSCEAVCPLLVSDVQRIERQLTEVTRKRVRFVLVSFDPARDTPQRLARYAVERKLDSGRWKLLTGDDDAVRELAAVLGVRYRPSGGGDFAHSNLITVLDGRGVVTHRQVGLGQDPAPALEAIARAAAAASTRPGYPGRATTTTLPSGSAK